MANTIKHKRGSGSNPSANDLVAGEIAIRTDTGVLFIKKDDNSLASISGGSTNLGVSTTSSAVTVTSSTGNNATISEASGSAAGVMSTAHHDKLDGIEANATADQSASEILTAVKTVDGSGSGLDADLVDGIQAGSFLRSDANDSASGTVDFLGGTSTTPAVRVKSGGNSWSEGIAIHPSANNGYALAFFRTTASLSTNTNTWAIGNSGASGINSFTLLRNGLTGSAAQRADAVFDVTQAGTFRFGFTPTVGSNTIWHAGNDGASSGLDADLLDGVQGSSFLRSDAADTKTSGHLTFNDNVKAQFGGSGDLQIYHDASNSYIADTGAGNLFIRANAQLVLESNNGENYLAANENGDVHLYYDGGVRLSTKSDGVDITGELQCDTLDVDGGADITGNVVLHDHLDLGDDNRIRMGAGDDLHIYHNGTHSYIKEEGTGELRLGSNNAVRITKHDSETIALFNADADVELYHNNSKVLETFTGGVNIIGLAQCDSLDCDGAGDISGNLTLSGTGTIKVPVGTTNQRPTAVTGMIRFNTTRGCFEGYNGSNWVNMSPLNIDDVGAT